MNQPSILWEETIQPGATWSHVMKRGTALRITDVEGGANVGALFYNFECPVERYNMPDTLKAQHIARLTKGFVLYSDMGRILCSITEDSVGRKSYRISATKRKPAWQRAVGNITTSRPKRNRRVLL